MCTSAVDTGCSHVPCMNGQNIVSCYLYLSSSTLTGVLTSISGVFNSMTVGGEGVATTSVTNPAIQVTSLNT